MKQNKLERHIKMHGKEVDMRKAFTTLKIHKPTQKILDTIRKGEN